ncbi:hypothetical protein CPB86DRAFT_789336 [Serendipita vermifera]|nr:hypothetical protein CPB86DRAFT_789336 [Serendipita vermifera]
MDKVPEDILLLIFGIYVHEYNLSATSLLTVCRRWHDVLLSNPTSWSQVKIVVESLQSIPTILAGGRYGLQAYLSRSEKEDASVLLDISIEWPWTKDKKEEHGRACPLPIGQFEECPPAECGLARRRVQQLKDLFKVLIDADGSNYVKRWASLKLDLHNIDPIQDEFDPISLFGNAREVVIPNLHSLSLGEIAVDFSSVRLPSLKKLMQRERTSTITLASVDRVEVLGLTVVKKYDPRKPIPIAPWPRLHTLRISTLRFLSFLQDDTSLKLKTFIFDKKYSRWNDFSFGQVRLDTLSCMKSLQTFILLGTSVESLFSILDRNPGLIVPNWKLGSACYNSALGDEETDPQYYVSPRGPCGPSPGNGESSLTCTRSVWMTMAGHKMKVESLDTCITDTFARAYSKTPQRFRTRVIDSALTEGEMERLNEYIKTMKEPVKK